MPARLRRSAVADRTLSGSLRRWPLLRQLLDGGNGTGPEAFSERTRNLGSRLQGTKVSRSVCPYCAVGCGQLVRSRDNELISIEGDPESPISAGALCPKGAASYELLTHPGRETRVKYRAARATEWEEIPLEQAMDMIADRVWATRRRSLVKSRDGRYLNHTTAMGHLGGATLDNEENYLIKKLFTGGLGMVAVSNQART